MIESAFYELYVKSIDDSEKFYQLLGLSTSRKQSDFAVLTCNGIKIHLCPIDDCPEYLRSNGFSGLLGSRVEFCFVTDQIEKLYGALVSNNVEIYEGLQERPWGKKDFRIIDPDGAYIRVTSPRYFKNSCLRSD